MENIPKYLLSVLALIGFLSVQAQDLSIQPELLADPKLSAEHGVISIALSNNPAKPTTPDADSKRIAEEALSTISKPPADQMKDSKLEAEADSFPQINVNPAVRTEHKVTGTPFEDKNVQPAGIVPETIINYREIKGPDNQPAAPKPAKVTDFRKQNEPNTQPAGDKPKG